jgi:hypothetical protein
MHGVQHAHTYQHVNRPHTPDQRDVGPTLVTLPCGTARRYSTRTHARAKPLGFC